MEIEVPVLVDWSQTFVRGECCGEFCEVTSSAYHTKQEEHDYANSRAWYLPVSSWTTNGEGGRGRDGEGGGGGEGGARGSKELLPKLYSSRIYKEYLSAQNVQRIPHYLANVASPPPKPPKAGRGGSPSPPRRSESPEGSS